MSAIPSFLHQTDIFRPHNDPDDHWDLACAYALAAQNLAVLDGILIDHPPGPPILNHKSDPDLGSVAQLSYITGLWPSIAVGRPEFFSKRGDFLKESPPMGVRFILEKLGASPDGLFLMIVGSARDVAEAIAREPSLFAEKCRGIYLNVGSGSPDPAAVKALEWNVKLDPAGYARIWEAPCPIFWMPCLEDENGAGGPVPREYATHYRFPQKDILDDLPKRLQNYFGWMFTKQASSAWLEMLDADFSEILAVKREDYRFMYSTGAFFDLAGFTVTRAGDMVPKSANPADAVYRFEPIDISCAPEGVTRWKPAAGKTDRYLFHVLDTGAYAQAMARAMKTLILGMCS